jgi:hypothetical protein
MTDTTPPLPDEELPVALRMDGTDAMRPAPSLRDLASTEAPAPAEAGLPGQVIRVRFEPGSGQDDYEVRTTNRDYIRWDKTPKARRAGIESFSDAPFVFASFLAWAAGRRLGQTDLTFDQFLELAESVERQSEDEVPPTR